MLTVSGLVRGLFPLILQQPSSSRYAFFVAPMCKSSCAFEPSTAFRTRNSSPSQDLTVLTVRPAKIRAMLTLISFLQPEFDAKGRGSGSGHVRYREYKGDGEGEGG